MRLLVTGAAGFIGSHLVDRLVADGHDVVGIDDLSTGSLANLGEARKSKGFRFHRFDVLSDGLPQLVAKAEPEVVLHLAARSGEPLLEAGTNVLGTVNLLAACTGVDRVVMASSGSVYGASRTPVTERTSPHPETSYGASKAAAELLLSTYPIKTCALRLGTVYGPRDDRGVVGAFIGGLRGGTTRVLGSSVRDLVYVDDVVDAFLRCLGGKGDGRRFNIASGQGTAVRDLHSAVATAMGRADAPEFGPARGLASIVLDVGQARRTLGWEPVVGLEQGLALTLQT